MRQTALIGAVLLLHFGSASGAAQGDDGVEVRQRGTNAAPIERSPPKYPKEAANDWTEGWVVVSFVVGIDGSTQDIEILDTSIPNVFEKSALRTVKRWTYKPATLNGQPVPQAKTKVRLIFLLEGQDGKVSHKFLVKFKQALREVNAGDLEKAKKSIDRLDGWKQSVLAEVCYLDILKAMYWQKKGDEYLALRHFERALIIADDAATEAIYVTALRQAFALNVNQKHLVDALAHYKTLIAVVGKRPEDKQFHETAVQVQDYLDSDNPYATEGKIYEPCDTCQESQPFWHHSLYRSRFSIDQIDGIVSEFKLLCGFHYVTIAWSPGMSWNIEDDWGQCEAHVYGDVGTTFRLVEH